MAPEILKNQYHDYKVDIWALGIILYEMVAKKWPFDGINENAISY